MNQLEGRDFVKLSEALDQLKAKGPDLGRPLADHIKRSKLHKLKELRPLSTNIRVLFIFGEERQAVLLCAGDKTDKWQSWYEIYIAIAEERYRRYLNGNS